MKWASVGFSWHTMVMAQRERLLISVLISFGCLGAFGQAIGEGDEGNGSAGPSGVRPSATYIRPTIVAPNNVAPVKSGQPWLKPDNQQGVNWSGILRASLMFSTMQHSFRVATEPGTREGLKGAFFDGWGPAAASLHGWSDGDPFYVNYVGHPMQGSVAGFIWANNDRRYSGVEFGANADYWRSRLRSTAFSFAYSEMFEIGPYSEASIGNVQSTWPQQGWVDHVITPSVGLLWMIAEDALDRHVIKRLEERVHNRPLRVLIRGTLNPSRSWANMMGFNVPWARTSRPGIYSGQLDSYFAERRPSVPVPRNVTPPQGEFGVAPFELSTYFRPVFFKGGAGSCLGGGAEGAFRIVNQMQWVVDVSGCNLIGMPKDWSGDSLTYLTGPKWTPRPDARWSPYVHFLVGGTKITQEKMLPELRESLIQIAKERGVTETVPKPEYASTAETSGFSLAVGGGVDVRLHPAFGLRLANLEYRRSWNPVMNGQNYNNGLSLTVAMVLRMGTW